MHTLIWFPNKFDLIYNIFKFTKTLSSKKIHAISILVLIIESNQKLITTYTLVDFQIIYTSVSQTMGILSGPCR